MSLQDDKKSQAARMTTLIGPFLCPHVFAFVHSQDGKKKSQARMTALMGPKKPASTLLDMPGEIEVTVDHLIVSLSLILRRSMHKN